MTSGPSNHGKQEGYIVPSFEDGALFLRDSDGRFFRLEWSKKQAQGDSTAKTAQGTDRRRGLAPGKYTLTGYRIVRRDSVNREWFISVTSRGIRDVVVRGAEEQVVQINDTIKIRFRGKRTEDGVATTMALLGDHDRGLTIYREGKRIPVEYAVRDLDGEKLAGGAMDYG